MTWTFQLGGFPREGSQLWARPPLRPTRNLSSWRGSERESCASRGQPPSPRPSRETVSSPRRSRLVRNVPGDGTEAAGAVVGRVAFLVGTPHLLLRGLSDRAGTGSSEAYPRHGFQAAHHVQAVLMIPVNGLKEPSPGRGPSENKAAASLGWKRPKPWDHRNEGGSGSFWLWAFRSRPGPGLKKTSSTGTPRTSASLRTNGPAGS